jgi:hypothetical protein
VDQIVEGLKGTVTVAMLREWRRDGCVDKLATALADAASSDTRWWAARLLGSFGTDASERAIDALVSALRDSDGAVRIRAARSLGEVRDPVAIPALVRVAETTSWPVLREWVTDSLATLSAPEAIPLLIEQLQPQVGPENNPARRWGRRFHWNQRWAAKHLARIGTRTALEPLRAARARDPLRRWIYSRAISAIDHRHPA